MRLSLLSLTARALFHPSLSATLTGLVAIALFLIGRIFAAEWLSLLALGMFGGAFTVDVRRYIREHADD